MHMDEAPLPAQSSGRLEKPQHGVKLTPRFGGTQREGGRRLCGRWGGVRGESHRQNHGLPRKTVGEVNNLGDSCRVSYMAQRGNGACSHA